MRSTFTIVALWVMCSGTPAWAQSNFAGTWQTTFGPMLLKQEGKKVHGAYVMAGRRCPIEGTATAGKLVFHYQEPTVRGAGEFRLAADGQSFTGSYHEDGSAETHPWIGKRVRLKLASALNHEPAGFSGLWESPFGRMRLQQTGNQVRGCYQYGGGSTITGKLDGQRLVFRYREPTGVSGDGWFELSDQGAVLRGKWRADGQPKWLDWPCRRIVPVSGQIWLVVLEARWERDLTQQEYVYGDMLRTFFARYPFVKVRQRAFRDEAGLRHWCQEIPYLAEPTLLVVASHANSHGIGVEGKTIGPEALVESLQYADNLRLLHFSACLAMRGDFATKLVSGLRSKGRFAISGYTTSVDWAASVLIEFSYLDLILGHSYSPARAAEQVKKLLPFAGDKDVPEAPFHSAGLRLVELDAKK